MKYLLLQALCKSAVGGGNITNVTTGNYSSNGVIRDCKSLNALSEPVYLHIGTPEKSKEEIEEANTGAVLYIVAVLVFYSAGIVIMIIKYLRRERREMEEERILEDFFRSMPACKKEREQDNVNRVAIHAFHALTSFNESQCDIDLSNNVNESIVTYVDRIREDDHRQPVVKPNMDINKEANTKVSEPLITDL